MSLRYVASADTSAKLYAERERELLNRLLARDPSEFLTLQAGTLGPEGWPKREQLLTDRDEARYDRSRRGGD